MAEKRNYIIDFDSTLVQVEALDELAKLSLKNSAKKEKIVAEIQKITAMGMEGKIPIRTSLEKRLSLIKPHKKDIAALVGILKKKISPSFKRNMGFFKKHSNHIFVVTNGFREYVVPVLKEFGVLENHIFANTFKFDKSGYVIGFDKSSLLSEDRGKVKVLKGLKLPGETYVIGDGYTDYQIKEAGVATHFVAFTENVEREIVKEVADSVVKSFDEFLYKKKLPMRHSYPRSKIRVLLLENIDHEGVKLLEKEGFSVETAKGALDETELIKRIKEVSILGIRSKTSLSKKALNAAERLLCVGAFCIGTDHIEAKALAEKGAVLFNAPYSNTRSVVELAVGEIIMLIRRAYDASVKANSGIWQKSSAGANEVRGKKIGIVGYGNIGSQLSVVAESLGMRVYFYDIADKLALGNATKCRSLKELLSSVDIVSLHVDGRASNRNMISDAEFKLMRDGCIFLNLSRGSVVEISALAKALKSGKIRGAGVDVFPKEPKTNDDPFESELQGIPNVILTPHIGGSTQEAQRSIAEYVAERFISYINNGDTTASVNFPEIILPRLGRFHRLLHVHRNVPGILAKVNGVLARHNINVEGQYLKTNEEIGYLVTDVNKRYDESVLKELKSIEDTIKFRVLQ